VLVLSRKCEQSLLLGEDITITVLAIDGERVKLGIEAPRSVTVLRSEVHDQLQVANAAAAKHLDPSSVHTIGHALQRFGPAPELPSEPTQVERTGVTGSSFTSTGR
jgi:carbon storage regulator